MIQHLGSIKSKRVLLISALITLFSFHNLVSATPNEDPENKPLDENNNDSLEAWGKNENRLEETNRFIIQGPSFTINLMPLIIAIKFLFIGAWFYNTLLQQDTTGYASYDYATGFSDKVDGSFNHEAYDNEVNSADTEAAIRESYEGIINKDLELMALDFIGSVGDKVTNVISDGLLWAGQTLEFFADQEDNLSRFYEAGDDDDKNEQIVGFTDIYGNDITDQVYLVDDPRQSDPYGVPYGDTNQYNDPYVGSYDTLYQNKRYDSGPEEKNYDFDSYGTNFLHNYNQLYPDQYHNEPQQQQWQAQGDAEPGDPFLEVEAPNMNRNDHVYYSPRRSEKNGADSLSHPGYNYNQISSNDVNEFHQSAHNTGASNYNNGDISFHTVGSTLTFPSVGARVPGTVDPHPTLTHPKVKLEHPANKRARFAAATRYSNNNENVVRIGSKAADLNIESISRDRHDDVQLLYDDQDYFSDPEALEKDIIKPKGRVDSIQDILVSNLKSSRRGNKPSTIQQILKDAHSDRLPKPVHMQVLFKTLQEKVEAKKQEKSEIRDSSVDFQYIDTPINNAVASPNARITAQSTPTSSQSNLNLDYYEDFSYDNADSIIN